MATKVKRIAVSFSPEIHDALQECSKVSGIATSQIVTLLMSNTRPVLDAMTKAFRTARADPTAAIKILGGLAEQVAVDAAQLTMELNDAAAHRKPRRTTRRD